MSQTHAHPVNTAKHKKDGAALPGVQLGPAPIAGPVADLIADPVADLIAGPVADPVPAPEQGPHAHSHAAHLEQEGAVHTKPEGNLRQGSAPGALREPPMMVQRVGKQHRGQ